MGLSLAKFTPEKSGGIRFLSVVYNSACETPAFPTDNMSVLRQQIVAARASDLAPNEFAYRRSF
jgi:hypothetical protein